MRARIIIIVAALLVSAGVVARADRYENVPMRASFDTFPMQIAGWRGELQPPLADNVLAVLGLTDYVTRNYVKSKTAVISLYIGYWQSQRQGETIHSPQNCLPGAGWEPVSQSIIQIENPQTPGTTVPVNRYVIQKGLDRQVALYWYQSHGRIVASEYWSKFYLISDAVRLNRTDGSIVRVIAPVAGDSPEALAGADAVALGFVHDLLPVLGTFLPN